MQKSLTAFSLALSLVGTLAACGGQGNKTASALPSSHSSAPSSAASGSSSTASSSSTSAPSSSTSQKLVPLKVTFAAFSTEYGPFLTAIEKGYYKQEGLKIQVVHMGGGHSTPALISGAIQISTSSASATTAIVKGYPLKIIEVSISSPPYYLISQANITKLSQLKGKPVGIQTNGDTIELATIYWFTHHGMSPSAVSLIPIGYDPQRVTAFEAKTVAATLVDPADLQVMKGRGDKFNILAHYAGKVPMPITGAATSDKFLKAHPDLVEKFLIATFKGAKYYYNHPTADVAILKKYNPKTPSAALKTDITEDHSLMNLGGVLPKATLQTALQLYANYLKVKTPSVSSVYDFTQALKADKVLGLTPKE